VRVFLTGASSGIGAALARHYGARGATLGLVARREEALQQLGRESGCPFAAYACDVTQARALRAAAQDFIARHGVPDLVIANAGISHGTLTDYAEDARTFAEILEVNVLGIVHTFQPFMEPMRDRRSGRLAGIASVAGFRGLPGAGAYSASKAAAIRYLEALRVELHGSGVGVSTICPGYVASPMTERNPYPMPFLLQADEAARRIARAIDAGRSLAVIPWQMAIAARLLALLPNPLFDRLASRGGRKPRRPR
jgi:short-subunit dehydrogenase